MLHTVLYVREAPAMIHDRNEDNARGELKAMREHGGSAIP